MYTVHTHSVETELNTLPLRCYEHLGFCMPCSYDTWLSASDVDVDVEEAPASERPWKVRELEFFHYLTVTLW